MVISTPIVEENLEQTKQVPLSKRLVRKGFLTQGNACATSGDFLEQAQSQLNQISVEQYRSGK